MSKEICLVRAQLAFLCHVVLCTGDRSKQKKTVFLSIILQKVIMFCYRVPFLEKAKQNIELQIQMVYYFTK